MARPRITDDGRTVVLDLHGVTVEDATRIIRWITELAGRRGRDTLRIVHGSSTSDSLSRTRTIRQALHDLLDDDELRPWVAGTVRYEDFAILSLRVSPASERRGVASSARLATADLYSALR